MILIYFELWIPKLEFLNPKKKKKFLICRCVFPPLNRLFPSSLSPVIRFDSRFEAKLQSVKLSSVIREAKVTDPSWKEKVMRGLVDGHSRRLKIARRQWNIRSGSVDFRLYWRIRAIHLLSAFRHKFLSLSLFFFTSICYEPNDHGMKRFALKFHQLWLLSIQNKLHFCAWQMYYRDDENMISDPLCLKIQKMEKKKRFRID